MPRIIRLGIFIAAALLILATGIFLIGDKEFLFSSTYSLKSSFPNVAGLNNGAQVRVGGIHKGTVRQIQLPPDSDGKMIVLMDLESSTRDVVKKDSVAAIQTEGLLGNKYVEISFGSDNAPKVEAGDTIEGAPPLDMADLLKKTNEILESTKESTQNLQDISGKINDSKGTLGALVNDKTLYQELSGVAEQAKAGTTAFQENMQALKSSFFLRGFFKRRGYDDLAELTKHEIAQLPKGNYEKQFLYDAKQIFDKPDSAKLKNQKKLNEVGKYLENGNYGLAVVVAYQGMKGDSEEAETLSQARAMLVRDYLVENFPMDDARLKTLGLGKTETADAGEAGKVAILVYPPSTAIPVTAGQSDNSSRKRNKNGKDSASLETSKTTKGK
ncbi:MAG: MCE family protein [Acidobacteria bacterium]|nr:MCE family protein [Acidobacteriota bacterium]